jgi:dipeptidyl-peptidase-4|tara:strand:+ start:474 stop:2627 length:2154 start_codon:yes stop_codon:yes gene_type:complete
MKKTILIIFSALASIICFSQNKQITLEDIWLNYSLFPKSYSNLNSLNSGEHYSILERVDKGQEIIKYNFKTGKKNRTVFKSEDFDIKRISNYKFSEDENLILLATESKSIYRYSREAIYYVYNVHNNKIKKLHDKKVRYPSFSPDGKKIAFIFENNLFIKNITNGNLNQITNDGKENYIINGASDWVYEEEFKLVKGFAWSGNSKTIAYYKFDESHVRKFSMDLFKNKLYPQQEEFKYPKAGEKNSTVNIYFYNTDDKINKLIFTEKDYEYIPRIKWTEDPNVLSLTGLNRHQNKLDFIIANYSDGTNKVLFSEEDKYYIDINDNLTFLPNNYFIWTSEKDGYNHIYLKGLDGSEEQLTNGAWEVTSFDGLDSDNMKIFYRSTEEGSINRTLYVLDLETGKSKKLSKDIGTNSVKFSKGLKYYINSYSNANIPPVYSLHKSDGKELKILEDNKDFQTTISEYNITAKEFFKIPIGDYELNSWVIKPPNFDKNKEYPLFMFLYGGPGSQKVLNQFESGNYFWHQMLAQQGYIVACVDNRGTGGKGSEFKKMTYKELGKYELIDQIEAAKYFGKLNYIDSKRIGIQGWSYGGYMSSLAITKGSDFFKLAIAVAPVTNWRYYDNIYTERYMQTPQENASGYDENSPINFVDKLKGKYLLIHGSADDNVHVQNTYEMTSALVKANKQFDLFIYPDKNHGIYGGNTRLHLYKKMTDFIKSNL